MDMKEIEKKAVFLSDLDETTKKEAKSIGGSVGGVKFRNVPPEKVRVMLDTNRELDAVKVKSMAANIKETGMVKPVLANTINGSGGVVHVEDGHHRVKALSEVGVAAIPVYEVDPEVHDAYNKNNGFAERYRKSGVKAAVKLPINI